MTDTYTPVLTDAQILAIGTFGQSPLKRLDHGRAIERAAIEAYQRQQWRPIESAPMDGTRIILAWGGKSIVGFYLDNSDSLMPWKGWRTESMVPRPAGEPTRWMPLPPPPEKST